MLLPQTCALACKEAAVTTKQEKKFARLVEDKYRVRLSLDNMPVVMRMLGSAAYTLGYPLGFEDKDTKTVFINNHLRFTIMYHKPMIPITDSIGFAKSVYRVVGFEVEPMSVNHKFDAAADADSKPTTCPVVDTAEGQPFREGENIAFTYDLEFKESELEWATRWDPLLTTSSEQKQIQWFAILNSFLLGLFLTALLALILLRTVHRDISKYTQIVDSIEEDEDSNAEVSGWKILHGDVFRPPRHVELLVILVGTGCQIVSSIVIILVLGLLGVFSPAYRGGLLTAILLLWVVASSVCGYVAGRLYRACGGTDWKQVAFSASFAFPSLVFGVFLVLNFFMWLMGSISAVPILTIFFLLFLWIGVSVPLVFLGTLAGYKQKPYDFPVRTNLIPRKIPPQGGFLRVGLFFISGALPFGVICIELLFILDSLWQNELYYAFGFLGLVFTILIITSAETSIIIVYVKLVSEDYNWWWQSLWASASSGLYVLLFSIYYIISQTELDKSHVMSNLLYLGYMSLISIMFSIMTGAIGFLGGLWFVKKIYAAVRAD